MRSNSLSDGRAICLETRLWRCAFTSNVPPGEQTKPRCSARRFTSISKRARLAHDEPFASCSVEVASAC